MIVDAEVQIWICPETQFPGKKVRRGQNLSNTRTGDNFIRVIHGFHRVFFHSSDDLMACEVQQSLDDVPIRQQLQCVFTWSCNKIGGSS